MSSDFVPPVLPTFALPPHVTTAIIEIAPKCKVTETLRLNRSSRSELERASGSDYARMLTSIQANAAAQGSVVIQASRIWTIERQ